MIVFISKECSKCRKEIPCHPEYFRVHKNKKYGYSSICKNCSNILDKNRYHKIKNTPQEKQKRKKYRDENKNRQKELHNKWKEENREHLKTYQREYCKNRYKNDNSWRVLRNCRSLAKHHITEKTKKTTSLLGCSGKEWMDYLETMFESGMTRDNYGTVWQVDHIIPISHGINDEHKMSLFHYLNTQPMFSSDNNFKSDRCVISIPMEMF